MEDYAACEKCGLKAVRYELERCGIVLRFCDMCYWGEANTIERAPDGKVDEQRETGPTSGKVLGGEIRPGAGTKA